MSTELRRLEAMVKEIHQEMLFLRSREEEMRNINGQYCFAPALAPNHPCEHLLAAFKPLRSSCRLDRL